MDVRTAQAREHHRLAQDAQHLADRHRQERNRLIRSLVADGQPVTRVAADVGIGYELARAIVAGRT